MKTGFVASRRAEGVGLPPLRVIIAVCAAVTLAAAGVLAWTWVRWTRDAGPTLNTTDEFSHPAAGLPPAPAPTDAPPSPKGRTPLAIPQSVFTVTLADELFPESKPPTPPSGGQPQPRLTLQLVAITGEGDKRRVFVRDPQADVYHDLGIGEPASAGVTLSEATESSAIFLVSGNRVTLELPK